MGSRNHWGENATFLRPILAEFQERSLTIDFSPRINLSVGGILGISRPAAIAGSFRHRAKSSHLFPIISLNLTVSGPSWELREGGTAS